MKMHPRRQHEDASQEASQQTRRVERGKERRVGEDARDASHTDKEWSEEQEWNKYKNHMQGRQKSSSGISNHLAQAELGQRATD